MCLYIPPHTDDADGVGRTDEWIVVILMCYSLKLRVVGGRGGKLALTEV